MSLSCTPFWRYSKILVENRWFEPTLPLIWHCRWGWPRWSFTEIFHISELESLVYRTALLAWFWV